MPYTVVAYDSWTGAEVTYREAEELTRDLLDDIYDPFVLGELSFPASVVLEGVDPIAFRETVLEEIDAHITDGAWTEDPPESTGDADR